MQLYTAWFPKKYFSSKEKWNELTIPESPNPTKELLAVLHDNVRSWICISDQKMILTKSHQVFIKM